MNLPPNWIALQEALRQEPEEVVWEWLEAEKSGARRPQWLLRLYGRANALRTTRERKELVNG